MSGIASTAAHVSSPTIPSGFNGGCLRWNCLTAAYVSAPKSPSTSSRIRTSGARLSRVCRYLTSAPFTPQHTSFRFVVGASTTVRWSSWATAVLPAVCWRRRTAEKREEGAVSVRSRRCTGAGTVARSGTRSLSPRCRRPRTRSGTWSHSAAPSSEPRELLAGVEQPFRVERPLDLLVQLERPRRPLTRELSALDPTDAVLARDRAAEPHGEPEELLGRLFRPRELVVGRDEEGRVQVAVAGMPPAAGGQIVAAADRDGLVDRLGEPVEGNDDVLAHLAAMQRGHGDRDPVAPTPERFDLACRGRSGKTQGAGSENLDDFGAEPRGLVNRTVR